MKIKLVEETLEQATEKAINAAPGFDSNDEVIFQKGDIEKMLDRALKTNKRQQGRDSANYMNVLLVGQAGTGKTARVEQWAKDNGINLYFLDAKLLEPTDLGGAVAPDFERGTTRRFSTEELDNLDRPNSVLFLDEYNRARSDVRGSLLTLVNNHKIQDARSEDKTRSFPNMLFTIAAINPAAIGYDVNELDSAERSRFAILNVAVDKRNHLNYLNKFFDKQIEASEDPAERLEYEGRKSLANALLGTKGFDYDTPEEEEEAHEHQYPVLNNRSFTNLLEASDGTKEDFLDLWDSFCNPRKKSSVERILANYKDVEDKANDALKGGTQSEIFGKSQPSDYDKIMAALGNL